MIFHRPSVGLNRAFVQTARWIGDDDFRIQHQLETQALAIRTGTPRRIETEYARLQFRKRAMAVGASQMFAEQDIAFDSLVFGCLDQKHSISELQCRLDGVSQTGFIFSKLIISSAPHHQSVHHRFDIVDDIAIQFDFRIQGDDLTIDTRADVTPFSQCFDHLMVMPFFVPHDRGQNQQAAACCQLQQFIDHLLGALSGNDHPAAWAVRNADPGVKQTQVVINLGDRPHRRSRVFADTLLIDGYGRAQTFDLVHIGLFHLPQKLTRIGTEAFDVTALPLRKDRVKGEGRFSGTREAGDHHQLVAGNIDIDVL